MAKLGTEAKPVVVCVHSDEMARYVIETCAEHGWYYIIGLDLDKPEDISDLERLLNPGAGIKSTKTIVSDNKVGRNSPCPCGSGKKYKKCCGANGILEA